MSSIALCIPAFNAQFFLPRLLDSANKQLVKFDEIIVYDDASSDLTAQVAKDYGAEVIIGVKNIGCAKGRNILAKAAKSEWLHFHDADDELLPNFNNLAHKWISKINCEDIILFDYEYRDNESNELLGIRIFDKEKLYHDPTQYAILEQINPFCGLYRKNSFLKAGGSDTDSSILYNEDCAMHLKLAQAGLTFSVEHEISIINYRIENSMSQGNQLKCIQAQFNLMNKYINPLGEKYSTELGSKFWSIATMAAAYKDWKTCDNAIKNAIKLGYKTTTKKDFFNWLCEINPFWAVKIREYYIRLFKSYLRN